MLLLPPGFIFGLISGGIGLHGAVWGSTDAWPTTEMKSRSAQINLSLPYFELHFACMINQNMFYNNIVISSFNHKAWPFISYLLIEKNRVKPSHTLCCLWSDDAQEKIDFHRLFTSKYVCSGSVLHLYRSSVLKPVNLFAC